MIEPKLHLCEVLSKRTRNDLVLLINFLPSLLIKDIQAFTPRKLHKSLKMNISVLKFEVEFSARL